MTRRGRTLFIHIGPAKTGTSAIQHVLSANPDTVPIYPQAGRWWDSAHHDLVFSFYKDYSRSDASRADIEALFEQIGRETRSRSAHVLISSEAFWGRDIGAFVQALLPHLDKIQSVEILATCREHFALTASIYNQLVKDFHFSEQRLPDDFLTQEAPMLTYARTLEALSNGDYPLRLFNYHPAEDFARRFLSHVEFDGANDAIGTHNASLSIKGMIAMLGVNRVITTPEERQSLYRAFEAIPGFFGPRGIIFTTEAVLTVKQIFDEDRHALLEAYGIALPAPHAMPARSVFHLSPTEFEEIATALTPMSDKAEAVATFAHQFICGKAW